MSSTHLLIDSPVVVSWYIVAIIAAWVIAQAASRRSLADTRTALTLSEARWVSRHGQKWLGGIEDDRYTGREVFRDLVTAVGLPGPLDEAIRVEGRWRWDET